MKRASAIVVQRTAVPPETEIVKLLIHPEIDDCRLTRLREVAGTCEIVNVGDSAEAVREIVDAEGFFGKITPDLLRAATRLEWVQSPTASLEHYLFPELIEHPCRLSNMRGLFHDVIADHVMAYVLCFARNLHVYLRRQIDREWNPVGGEQGRTSFAMGPSHVTSIDTAHTHLQDATMGVVGVGSIGAETCRRAKSFGMSVLGVDPVVRSLPDAVEEVWPLERLDELLAVSDFVVIAAPHTPETERLFDAARLARMKPTARLINVGRGVIVDLADLVDALERGVVAGAALDVFEFEPLPDDHPLWERDDVILTPHVAAASPRVPERHLETLVENVRRFAHGEEPLNLVDKRRWF